MIYLTVTVDKHGAGIQQLPVDDILYMQFDNRLMISVETESAQYFTVGNLRFWDEAFEKAGLNFLRLDRGILANVEKIRMVDSTYKIAYFGRTIANSKRCTMSTSGYKAIQDRLAIIVPQITLPF